MSHFVDDRIEVLELLVTVTRRYLFSSESDAGTSSSLPSNTLRVSSWAAIERDLLSASERDAAAHEGAGY